MTETGGTAYVFPRFTMTPSSPFKVGIIGAGGIVRGAHLKPGWTAVPGAQVLAVADVHRPAAEKLAADFQIPHVFDDYRELVKVPGLHAVDICAPNLVHTPAALAALEAGLHVLCEKPLATTVAEVRRLGDAAKAAGRLLMTAQHMRFAPELQAITRWAATGALGEVYHARVNATRRDRLPVSPGFIDPKLSGGGPCMDIGVHALDAALTVMGFPKPVRVTGTTRVNFAQGDTIPGAWGEWDRQLFGVEDFAAGFVHFENGATLTLEASWLAHQEKEDFSFYLLGTKAGVGWPDRKFYSAQNRVLVDGQLLPVKVPHPAHTMEILAFAEAVRSGRPSPVPVEQTIRVIAILEGIVQSCKEGREIILPSDL